MSDRKAQQAKDRDVFVAMFPHIVDEILKDAQTLYPDYDKDALTYLKRCLDYNVPGDEPRPECTHVLPSSHWPT